MSADDRSGLRNRVGRWIESAPVRNVIIVLILVNAVILGMETSDRIMDRIGGVLIFANQVILAVFVVEILVKLFAFGFRFFRSGWNVFDFAIVGIALVPASGPLEVLRALRILRVLRLLSQVKRLKDIIESLMRALPGMGWTAALLVLVFYIFAVMGTMLFGDAFPEYWGTLGRSFFSLFQIMTLESWSSAIARPMLEEIPLAWMFFVPFILVSSFMVLNLFIAIIVSATNAIHEDEEAEERRKLLDELRRINRRLDHLEEVADRNDRAG
jgi:voltage-gated sodium channel